MVEKSREQKDGVGKCLADCLLSCLDNMARYFNRWAFIYVGRSSSLASSTSSSPVGPLSLAYPRLLWLCEWLWYLPTIGIYGYSFTEAGARVFDLFQSRGLTAVINDSLISRVRHVYSHLIG